MGWLKALCEESGGRSLEQLARELQDSGSLVGARGKKVSNPRSGANLLREVDAGRRELSGELESAVAEALGIEVAYLRDVRAEEAMAQAPDPGRLRIPGTQLVIDPTKDGLPPGYPSLVLEPRRWSRHWWHAANMLAPEMRCVAEWVVARHRGVHLIEAANVGESLAQLPERGNAIILVEAVTGEEWELADELPRHLAALVVAAKPCLTEGGGLGGDDEELDMGFVRSDFAEPVKDPWKTVRTQTPNVARVVEWFAGRVEAGGGFEPNAARQLLAQPRFERACVTPGRIVELCQVIDDVRQTALERKRGRELLRTILKRRADEAAVRVLGNEPWDMIVELLKVLATRPRGLGATFGSEVLDALLPQPDMPHLRELASDESLSDAESRARLKSALQPTAKRLGAALAQLGWLTPVGERWRLGEHWMLRELLEEITDAWIAEAGESLGLALLAHDVAPLVIGRLYDRFLTGDLRALEVAMNDADLEVTSKVARLEGCLRAAGLASTGLPDSVREEVIRPAFHAYRQARAELRHNGPLIEWIEQDRGWLSPPVWKSALICAHGREWFGRHRPPTVITILDQALTRLTELPLVARALVDFAYKQLVSMAEGSPEQAVEARDPGEEDAGAGRRSVDELMKPSAVSMSLGLAMGPLQTVASVMEAVRSNSQSQVGIYDVLSAAKQFPALMDVLRERAAERRRSKEEVWAAIWAGRDGGKYTTDSSGIFARADAWDEAPEGVRAEALATAPPSRAGELAALALMRRSLLSSFPRRYWPALVIFFVRHSISTSSSGEMERILTLLPPDRVAAVVSAGAFAEVRPSSPRSKDERNQETKSRARFARSWWRRFSEETIAALRTLEDPLRAEVLISHAPFEVRGEILPKIVAVAGDGTRAGRLASRLVSRWVRQRVDGWEDAWRALIAKANIEDTPGETDHG